MGIKLSHLFITVDDHDKALAFYHDVLGLRVVNDFKFEGQRWITVSPPSQPEVEIGLFTPDQCPDASESDRAAIATLLAKGVLYGVNFTTDDCDQTFEKIRAAGAEVLQEPADQAYGVRDCAFRDPSGNMVRFAQKR